VVAAAFVAFWRAFLAVAAAGHALGRLARRRERALYVPADWP
jgi:hypothetical protein